jgi:hypothetical protein
LQDIAILTWNTSMCEYYSSESNNQKAKGLCSQPQYNNPDACASGGGLLSLLTTWRFNFFPATLVLSFLSAVPARLYV